MQQQSEVETGMKSITKAKLLYSAAVVPELYISLNYTNEYRPSIFVDYTETVSLWCQLRFLYSLQYK